MSWWGLPTREVGKARLYSEKKIASAGTNTFYMKLAKAGFIKRVALHAGADTEYFKLADASMEMPEGGHTMRLAHGQLLPNYEDARVVENMDMPIQAHSKIRARFYGMTAGVTIWLQVAILEVE